MEDVRESVCACACPERTFSRHGAWEDTIRAKEPERNRRQQGSSWQADTLSAGDRTRSAKTYLEVLLRQLHLGLAPQTKIHRTRRCPPLLLCEEKPISNKQAKSVYFLVLLKASFIQKLHTCQIYIPWLNSLLFSSKYPPFSVKMNPLQLILGTKNSSLYNIIISWVLWPFFLIIFVPLTLLEFGGS